MDGIWVQPFERTGNLNERRISPPPVRSILLIYQWCSLRAFKAFSADTNTIRNIVLHLQLQWSVNNLFPTIICLYFIAHVLTAGLPLFYVFFGLFVFGGSNHISTFMCCHAHISSNAIEHTHTSEIAGSSFSQLDCRLTSEKPVRRPFDKWPYPICFCNFRVVMYDCATLPTQTHRSFCISISGEHDGCFFLSFHIDKNWLWSALLYYRDLQVLKVMHWKIKVTVFFLSNILKCTKLSFLMSHIAIFCIDVCGWECLEGRLSNRLWICMGFKNSFCVSQCSESSHSSIFFGGGGGGGIYCDVMVLLRGH